MRIALIHQDLFFQGGEYVVAKLANGLAARGHEVHVIVSKVHTDIARQNPEAKPFRLASDVRFHVLPFRRALLNIVPLALMLRQRRYDVILPNTGHYNLCVAYAKRLLGIKAPTVYIEHNLIQPTTNKRNRMALRAARHIVAVSKGVRQAVVDSGVTEDKVSVVYNPVFDADFAKKKAQAAQHPWLRSRHPFTFIAAGALGARKGFDWLLKAFAHVHAKEPLARLIIFGRGEEENALSNQIQDSGLQEVVSLPGFTDGLLAEMMSADCFVLSSRRETFGIVLAEALGCNLDVVSADCPYGPREVLCDGALGQLVPVDDVNALAVAMLKVIRGEWKAAKAFDPSLYENDAVIARYEKLLVEVVHP